MNSSSSSPRIVAMQGYFKSRGYVPGGIITNCRQEDMDIEAMPPFLRTLLVTDGTVTKSLEAYFWEPVSVENLGQEVVTLEKPVDWLELPQGESVLQRKVRLIGGDTGNVYVYASSVLRIDLLPAELRSDLLEGKIGIGEMLRDKGLETYREIMDIGRSIDQSLISVFNTKHIGELIHRTYRVVINHKPSMLITEMFPYRLYSR